MKDERSTRAERIVGEARLWIVGACLVAWTLLLAPFQWLFLRPFVLARWPTGARVLPHVYHRGVARLIGIRIRVHGAPERGRPLLLVANHVSWADIVVLSAVMPVSFIAKSEMVTWPVFGWLARAQRTVFVDRADRKRAAEQADRISRRLEGGDAMVLFPEGTTGDGTRVLAFNASLFAAPGNVLRRGLVERVHVQPVALRYGREQGMALGRIGLRRVGWPGAVPLVPHLPDTIRAGALDVDVLFAPALPFERGTDRKQVSAAARETIRSLRSDDAAVDLWGRGH